MEQHKLHSCVCDKPGFCPVFKRIMGTNPPDWQWCQRSKAEDKKVFYDLLAKAPKTENQKLLEFFKELDSQNIKKNLYLLYYLTMNEKYHLCDKAQETQLDENKRITRYLYNQVKNENTFDKVEILFLGHSDKQFDSIDSRSYIKKINLNYIECGEYSDNKWAESRAFISNKSLFKKETEFVGFVTASWNLKYETYSRIDNFHNWNTAQILLNSKAEDGIVLCAEIFCPCIWFHGQESVLSVFFDKYYSEVGKIFFDIFDFSCTKHRKVPFANQMILHIDNYNKYKNYLIDNCIFEKVLYFSSETKRYMKQEEKIPYSFNRLHAYIMEMVSTFWFLEQDFIFLPNTERKEMWYTDKNKKERIEKWNMIS